MPVNSAIQGLRLPAIGPYVVGREKIREFASAVQTETAAPADAGSAPGPERGGVAAPPTFPIVVQQHTLAQLLAEPDTGIDFSRVVHGEQSFSFSRPVVAGDELTARLTVTAVKSLGAHSMVTAETEMVDLEGSHVVTAVSTLVVRGDE